MGQKITPKMLRGFLASERAGGFNGIGANDNWNIAHFGITQAEAAVVRKAMSSEYGMFPPKSPNLAALNRRA